MKVLFFVDGAIFFSISPPNEHITFRIAKTVIMLDSAEKADPSGTLRLLSRSIFHA